MWEFIDSLSSMYEPRFLTTDEFIIAEFPTVIRAEELPKWLHLKDLEIPDVHDEQVTMLIGGELADQKMKQFLRLEDVDMNRSSKNKGMSVEDQEARKRMGNSVCVVDEHYEVGM